MKQKFLTARWEYLVMANYEVNPSILEKYLPNGVEIDFWNNKTYVSLVGFMFLETKVLGIPVPLHTNFEEVNLRFYVKYKDKLTKEWKRGVVFIKEIVPKIIIAKIARWVYNENYVKLKMSHKIIPNNDNLYVAYSWENQNKWHTLSVNAKYPPIKIEENSEAQFITEHYWGYTKVNEHTFQYQVEHPIWRIFDIKDYQIEVNFGDVYGEEFDFLSTQIPSSVLLANGSEISVRIAGEI